MMLVQKFRKDKLDQKEKKMKLEAKREKEARLATNQIQSLLADFFKNKDDSIVGKKLVSKPTMKITETEEQKW